MLVYTLSRRESTQPISTAQASQRAYSAWSMRAHLYIPSAVCHLPRLQRSICPVLHLHTPDYTTQRAGDAL